MVALFFNDPNAVIQQYLAATQQRQLPTPQPLPVAQPTPGPVPNPGPTATPGSSLDFGTPGAQVRRSASGGRQPRNINDEVSTSRSRTRPDQLARVRQASNFRNEAFLDFTDEELLEAQGLDLSDPNRATADRFRAGRISAEDQQALLSFAQSLGLNVPVNAPAAQSAQPFGRDASVGVQPPIEALDTEEGRGSIRTQIADARAQFLDRAEFRAILGDEYERYDANQARYNEILRGAEDRALEELNLPSLNPVEATGLLIGDITDRSLNLRTGSNASRYAAYAAADFWLGNNEHTLSVNRQVAIWREATIRDVIENQVQLNTPEGATPEEQIEIESQVLARMVRDGELIQEQANDYQDDPSNERFDRTKFYGTDSDVDDIVSEYLTMIGVEEEFDGAWSLSHINNGADPRNLMTNEQRRQLQEILNAVEQDRSPVRIGG